MSKHYFFEAGTFPDLSFVELLCVLESFGISKEGVEKFSEKVFFVKDDKITDILFENISKRLGGFIRSGVILDDIDSFFTDFENSSKKVVFGISILGNGSRKDLFFLKKLGREIKMGLKGLGINSRFVPTVRDCYSLSTAQILKNSLLEKGFELLILRNNSREMYGRTLFVQDLEGFVTRDIERPKSDTKMGVLPPKLARMMINFTALRDGIIWDPFCGSGTILMEAGMLGFNLLGSDISDLAIDATAENILWLNRYGDIDGVMYETFRMDVTKAESDTLKKLKHTNISAIVCEPFMGPPQRNIVSEERADELLKGVKNLYTHLFNLIDNRLEKRGIKVVIVVPSYKTSKGWKSFGIRELVGSRWIVKNSFYAPSKELKWFRRDSIITRNIFILERS